MPLPLHRQSQNSQAMQHHIRKHSYSISSYRLSMPLAALLSVFILSACTSDNGSRTFGSSAEAAKVYHDYLSDVKQKDNLSIEELSDELNRWRSLSDSVLICLRRDTEQCCLAVFQSKDIPKEEATLYMTLRTSRRLIQNSATCMERTSFS